MIGISKANGTGQVAPIRNLNYSHEWLVLPRQKFSKARLLIYRLYRLFHHYMLAEFEYDNN